MTPEQTTAENKKMFNDFITLIERYAQEKHGFNILVAIRRMYVESVEVLIVRSEGVKREYIDFAQLSTFTRMQQLEKEKV